jgi:hypothetical protein
MNKVCVCARALPPHTPPWPCANSTPHGTSGFARAHKQRGKEESRKQNYRAAPARVRAQSSPDVTPRRVLTPALAQPPPVSPVAKPAVGAFVGPRLCYGFVS